MTASSRTALFAELCMPMSSPPNWTALGYSPLHIDRDAIQACESEPSQLQALIHRRLDGRPTPTLLVVACDPLPTTSAVDANWQVSLHEPLARCFTAVRGLTPLIAAHSCGGHVLALLPRAALLPEASGGTAAVLGRALVGLFESLRAELRKTTARATLFFTDREESADALHARLRHALGHRPFHSVPASIDREAIERYFNPLFVALSLTPQGVPLRAGPQGEVYQLDQLQDAVSVDPLPRVPL